MQRRDVLAGLTIGLPVPLAGCVHTADAPEASGIDESLTLAATTSIDDTGVLGPVTEAFAQRFGADVRVIAQGTGAALETARNGDCDVVTMHARSLEDEFLREGYGINRRALMASAFAIVGPGSDPAEIDPMTDVTAAFRAIAASDAGFVSRGDNSGTHRRELEIWDAAGIDPGGTWYREAGSGMGNVLILADEIDAYTLAVSGTFLAMRAELDIGIRLDQSSATSPDLLANPYGIAAVNPGKHPHVAYDLAMAFIGFVTSPAGQTMIGNYTVDGAQLFAPDGVSTEPNFGQYVPEDWESDR